MTPTLGDKSHAGLRHRHEWVISRVRLLKNFRLFTMPRANRTIHLPMHAHAGAHHDELRQAAVQNTVAETRPKNNGDYFISKHTRNFQEHLLVTMKFTKSVFFCTVSSDRKKGLNFLMQGRTIRLLDSPVSQKMFTPQRHKINSSATHVSQKLLKMQALINWQAVILLLPVLAVVKWLPTERHSAYQTRQVRTVDKSSWTKKRNRIAHRSFSSLSRKSFRSPLRHCSTRADGRNSMKRLVSTNRLRVKPMIPL